jgi:hypothetical protein
VEELLVADALLSGEDDRKSTMPWHEARSNIGTHRTNNLDFMRNLPDKFEERIAFCGDF